MNASLPGMNPDRLANLMRAVIGRCRLDLSGAIVLTEAATGAYVVTPVLTAMSGARRVFAIARPSRFGTVQDVTDQTQGVAHAAGVSGIIEVITERSPEVIAQADVITNTGHVRPIDSVMVAGMKPTAVVPLMYESWEFRASDVDLDACRRRGISVAGTNERHPAVDVFSYLGIMAVKLLLDAGVAVYGSRLLVLCDNPFGPFIRRGVVAAGASVEEADGVAERIGCGEVDAIVVALRPRDGLVIGGREARLIADRWPGAVVVQFWGDIDRAALLAAGVAHWPEEAPALGHMGILPSDVGPEPIVRLQAGGLKVAEVLLRTRQGAQDQDWEFVDALRTGSPLT